MEKDKKTGKGKKGKKGKKKSKQKKFWKDDPNRRSLGLVEPVYKVPRGPADSVRHHVHMIETYFLPLLDQIPTLRHEWRLGDERYTIRKLSDANDWASIPGRIAHIKSGLLVYLYDKDNRKASLPFQIWVRPPGKLNNYPRFNFPMGIDTYKEAMGFLCDHDICFLLVPLLVRGEIWEPVSFWADWYCKFDDTRNWTVYKRWATRYDCMSMKQVVKREFRNLEKDVAKLSDRIHEMLYQYEEGIWTKKNS